MTTRTHVPANPAFDTAWALFCQLHDTPSRAHADQLVVWLAESPGHVRALDEALTLWALAGAALMKPVLDESLRAGPELQ
jgi:ferric-dicitrate binding protein FerR (iron transport regulator)